jgi:hypothetical protein
MNYLLIVMGEEHALFLKKAAVPMKRRTDIG